MELQRPQSYQKGKYAPEKVTLTDALEKFAHKNLPFTCNAT